MQYEKIINDSRGQVRIQIRMYGGDFWNPPPPTYNVTVFHKAPRKRNEVVNTEIATPDEVYQAKIELWELCKPTAPID